jgi:subtilisin family serine protease
MLRTVAVSAVMVLAIGVILGSATSSASAQQETAVIVVLRDDVDPDSTASDHGVRHGARVSFVYRAALRGYAAHIPAARRAAIAADPRVAFISDDGPVWALDTLPTGIDRIDAEPATSPTTNATGPAIAVIDTGSGPHPDLNIAGGKNCSTGRSFNDGNGHGTHVAGTIAAKNDGAGVVGVLPGAPIYSVRVLNNSGSGTFATIICGIDWVTANAAAKNIKVANMSLGGAGADGGTCAATAQALQKAICNSIAAGVTYVVAAGNSNADFKDFVPATYDQVLTVTAMADFDGKPGGLGAATCRTDVDETPADFSNFAVLDSDQAHTIAGPGVCILSDWLKNGFKTISGTSMASPHVAGVAARCIASTACAGLTPAEIMAKLRADAAAMPAAYGFSGDPNSPIAGRYYGFLVKGN